MLEHLNNNTDRVEIERGMRARQEDREFRNKQSMQEIITTVLGIIAIVYLTFFI